MHQKTLARTTTLLVFLLALPRNDLPKERILERAQTAKAQARQLFAQARADLEKAKREIEALILGKDSAA
jgi:hypothetical protein